MLWSPSYFTINGDDASIAMIQKYIEQQQKTYLTAASFVLASLPGRARMQAFTDKQLLLFWNYWQQQISLMFWSHV